MENKVQHSAKSKAEPGLAFVMIYQPKNHAFYAEFIKGLMHVQMDGHDNNVRLSVHGIYPSNILFRDLAEDMHRKLLAFGAVCQCKGEK